MEAEHLGLAAGVEDPAGALLDLRLDTAAAEGTATVAIAEETPMKYRVYFGTYSGGKSKGIYRAELDLKTGKLTGVELAAETANPSFLAVHPSLKYLYAVGEGGGKEGTVSAFR